MPSHSSYTTSSLSGTSSIASDSSSGHDSLLSRRTVSTIATSFFTNDEKRDYQGSEGSSSSAESNYWLAPNVAVDPELWKRSVSSKLLATHPYAKPASTAVRGPCPGLNALANHGFLPRSGRKISMFGFASAIQQGYDLSWFYAFFLAFGAFLRLGYLFKLQFSINLDDLSPHNYLQHDGSLTREDFAIDPTQKPSPARIDAMLAVGQGTHSPLVSLSWAIAARHASFATSEATNHRFWLSPGLSVTAHGEVALIFAAVGDLDRCIARRDFVESLLCEERLPIERGWAPGGRGLGFVAINRLALYIALGVKALKRAESRKVAEVDKDDYKTRNGRKQIVKASPLPPTPSYEYTEDFGSAPVSPEDRKDGLSNVEKNGAWWAAQQQTETQTVM